MRTIDLESLKIFRTVVDEGGIVRAANKLNRVQSNVTTRIRQLEEHLGTRLFRREGRSIRLSAEGHTLLTYADRLLRLADETVSEMRAGKARLEAFRGLADRTRVDDVRSLVAMLIQTDKFGTSVANSLRVFSDVLRTKRRQRAEEAAAKTGVKMVFPLVFCIFPAIWVVTIGPAAIRFMTVLFPMIDNMKK